jgi:hypothetical protein
MQDALRQQFLQAMGQQVLVPRFRLLHAKPSVALVTGDVAANISTVSENNPVASMPSVAVTIADKAVPQTQAQTSASKNALSELLASSAALTDAMKDGAQPTVKIAPYRHRIVTMNGLVFLLDQPSLEWQQEIDCMKFFADIYFALFEKQAELIEKEKFEWPLGKLRHMTDDDAKATEQSFVQQQALQSKSQWLLIFGKKAAQQLVDTELEIGEAAVIGELNVLLVHAAEYYWQNPAAKKLLWQYLQVIRKSAASA